MRQYWLAFILLCLSQSASAQGLNITGKIQDVSDTSALIGVVVTATSTADSTQKTGNVTDVDGMFTITNIAAGEYIIRANYIGFKPFTRTLNVTGNVDMGLIKLAASATALESVVVTAEALRAQQSGDTTNFNAGAYKTNPDANAEDLITKMPGLTTEGGTLKANGEDVKRVLVDGKPFFGDDPNAAIKNLPAEIIDRIQVFDKMSDQAQLTGFSDGNEEKTINIITRPGKNTGQFGKLFGGIGMRENNSSDLLYQGGGNINFFKGNRRISLIALSNNINQQNFSTEDLMGVVNQSSGQSGGNFQGGGGRGGGGRGGGSFQGGGGDRGGGSNTGNFLVGQQAGITTTNSFGINYSDEWSKKLKVSGSYFFNNTSNDKQTSLARTYFTGSDSNNVYRENGLTSTKNTNHRANFRLEYEIDSMNTLIVSPRVSLQQNEYTKTLNGSFKTPDSTLLSSLDNRNTSNNTGYSLGGNVTYNHKFAKKGRAISLNLNSNINDRTGDGTIYSSNYYSEFDTLGNDSTIIQDQVYDLNSTTATHSANLTYTEPLNKNSQLMVNYAPSISNSNSDRETRESSGNGGYDAQVPSLSNKYENTYNTQRGGLSYRYNDQKIMFNAGVNYQSADLEGKQEFPLQATVDKRFSNFLPSAMLNYRFSRTKNLRLMYRTNTNAPSVSQLQNVYDVTNPLLVKTGNPDLSQDYQHTLMLRYGNTNTAKSTNFFVMAFANFTQDYIGNASYLFDSTTAIAEDIVLAPGSQLSMPVNLDGYWSARTFATYGMPIRAIKTNLNMNMGFNYNRIPAIINNIQNLANNYTVNGGLVLSSNISEAVDFTLSYSGYYNVVRNSIQTQSDNNYYNQNTALRLNWLHKQRLVVNTTVNHTLYSGLSQGFNQSFVLWNAGVGYKFLKDKSLDVRVNVYDILNQNRAIERTVTETYIEDSYTNVLQRYFMLNLTYTLRRFGGKTTTNDADMPSRDETAPMPPPGEGGGGGRRFRDGGQ